MGLFDKLKESAANVADMTKGAIETAKFNHEQKKAEEEQHRQEMNALATSRSSEIIESISSHQNNKGFFNNITKEELLSFTKEFYDKILMPANSVNKSSIHMYPYIDDKQIARLSRTWNTFNNNETVIFYLKADNNQEFVLTEASFYFSVALPEDPKYFSKGSVTCDKISEFSVIKNESSFEFKCGEIVLTSFALNKSTTEDLITLDNFFKCIINHDFIITDEEVDRLIQQKIGEKIYREIKKYMIYDDELLVYFAWGLDSLSAKDYIVCTNKQILKIDRELLGATANVQQFYYEDIVSANTIQNSKTGSLTVNLIDSAITAATKTCDLVISTAGSELKINTLFKVEAERIVAVYHHYRKEIKQATSQPQVIVQQKQSDPLEQLEKLSKLKEMGVISEEEFNVKKAELLSKI